MFEETLPHLRNLTVTVKEWQDEILFLHRVEPGRADKSYGIQVAQLAGLPAHVIGRAKEILDEHERMEERLGRTPATGNDQAASATRAGQPPAAAQLHLFSELDRRVAQRLRETPIDALTPEQASQLLRELRDML